MKTELKFFKNNATLKCNIIECFSSSSIDTNGKLIIFTDTHVRITTSKLLISMSLLLSCIVYLHSANDYS